MTQLPMSADSRRTEACVDSFDYVEHWHNSRQRHTVTLPKQRRTLCIHLSHGTGEELPSRSKKLDWSICQLFARSIGQIN